MNRSTYSSQKYFLYAIQARGLDQVQCECDPREDIGEKDKLSRLYQ